VIKPPSNQRIYDAVFSGDAAFEQLPDDATDEQQQEHARKWEVARETNDYSALRVEGAGEPTIFKMRQLGIDAFATIVDMAKSGSGHNETAVLAFRIALQDISNMGKVEIKRIQHKKFGPIATTEFFDKAGLPAGLSLQIATELGSLAIQRAQGLSKK
jgi:hypothetical protein